MLTGPSEQKLANTIYVSENGKYIWKNSWGTPQWNS